MTELEKQLIVISMYGITIAHEDGHRWIRTGDDSEFDYYWTLSDYGISVNNKIYGGVKEALLVIDETFRMMYGKSLVEIFDHAFGDDIKYKIDSVNTNHNRITKVKQGEGGLH